MTKCLPWPWLFKLWIVSIVIIFYRVLSRISSNEGKVSQSTIFREMFRFWGDTIFFYPNVPGVMLCWNNQALDKSYPYKIPENKVTEKESALGVHLSAWVKLC